MSSRLRHRLLLLSRYTRLGASSRLRHAQYLPALAAAGFAVDTVPFFDDAYLEAFYAGRRPALSGILAAYARRLAALARARRYDLLWLEKEFLPWFPAAWEGALVPAVPYVVDYDDAWFHRYDQHRLELVRRLLGSKIDMVMRRAALVVAGNDYLAEHARHTGAGWVEWLPTVLDPERYDPTPRPATDTRFVIGWIGTPHTAAYLTPLAPVLAAVCAGDRGVVRLIGGNANALPGVPVEVRPWHEENEAAELAACDVGLMPLPDAPFERGKCGYKLIQCMAAGRPVIASPVGVNTTLVQDGVTGFLADHPDDWRRALTLLRDTPDTARAMGAAGRARVETDYALAVTTPRLIAWLRRLCP